jgi:hypothetical protein
MARRRNAEAIYPFADKQKYVIPERCCLQGLCGS